MRDDQWTEAYSAGRREGDPVANALAFVLDHLEGEMINRGEGETFRLSPSLRTARTALEKYRERK